MSLILSVFDKIRWWVTGSTYIRFFHLTFTWPLFFYLEAAITLLAFFLPARRFSGLYKGRFHWLARHRLWACLAIFVLSISGRLVLLTLEPFPQPAVHDEFSYLLAGDTLAHGRLSNPALPAWHHFEAFHVLMTPRYASMYFPGFSLFLATGQRLFGTPRAGLLICAALAAASLCWMLQALLPPSWALLGGLLAVVRIEWFSYFGNTYWGGSAGMVAGCLLLGSSARLLRNKEPARSHALVFAFALFLLSITRPYEGAFLAVPVVAGTLWRLAKRRTLTLSVVAPALFVITIGAAWFAWYCHSVTGQFRFPQSVQRSQWGTASPWVFMRPNYSHVYEFSDQSDYYLKSELADVYLLENSLQGYLLRLPQKVFREWHFYIAPALTITLIGLIPTVRSRKHRLAALGFGALCLALLTETFVQPQYLAVGAGFLYLAIVNGLRWLHIASRRSSIALRLLNGTIAAVILTSALRLVIVPIDAWPPSWSSRNEEIPAYAPTREFLEKLPGKQLVFVRYSPGHRNGNSWINNGHDPGSQKVIWARDTEPAKSNADLICAFPGRQILRLNPPEQGFLPPPDTTASRTFAVAQFFKPYDTGSVVCPAETQ